MKQQQPGGRIAVGPSSDRFEAEARGLARQSLASPRRSGSRHDPARTSPRALQSLAPPRGLSGLGAGQPLPGSLRGDFENRFGHDFSAVRIHRDPAATALAGGLGARAFAFGRDVVFGAGHYSPDSAAGRQLLGHELVHTMQQGAAAPLFGAAPVSSLSTPHIQRDEELEDSGSHVTAQEVFPFPQDSQILVSRILLDAHLEVIEAISPEAAEMIRLLDTQRTILTVARSTPEVFEARLASPLTLPGEGEADGATVESATLTLTRVDGDRFTLAVSATVGAQQTDEEIGLTIRRTGGIVTITGISLDGTELPPIQVERVSDERVEFQGVQDLGPLGDLEIDMLRLDAIPSATTAPADVARAVERLADNAAGGRALRLQEFSLGVGGQVVPNDFNAMLSLGWRISFPTSGLLGLFGIRPEVAQGVGQVVRVPLQVELQWAPVDSVIGRASTGIDLSLASLNIPVNVRFLAGVGGGSFAVPGETGTPQTRGIFGPSIGGEVGTEFGEWRLGVRADQLFNVINEHGNVQTFSLVGGRAF